MRTAPAVLSVLLLTGCGLNIASLKSEHLQVPVPQHATPVAAPVSADVRTAERYAGFNYGGQVSVETEVIREHVINSLRAHGVSNIVDDPADARYRIETVFTAVGIDGTSTRTGFTSTWILYDGESGEALASTAAIAEEDVARFGFGKGRFRDAAARSIVKNTEDGLAVLIDKLHTLGAIPQSRDR